MSCRLSIIEDIRNTRSRKEQFEAGPNYQKLIRKQQEFIQSLQQQILLLKSYITLRAIQNQTGTLSIQSERNSVVKHAETNHNQGYKKQYQAFLQDLGLVLELKFETKIDQQAILVAVKDLKEEIKKKSEPIFVERVKQIKVPITIEKIIEKPVEKIVEKIVYIEKPTVVFKQKVIEKFIERRQEPISHIHSEKTLKIHKYEQEKEYQKPTKQTNRIYQNDIYYKKPEFGSNLIKKRDHPSKNYVAKGDSQKRYY